MRRPDGYVHVLKGLPIGSIEDTETALTACGFNRPMADIMDIPSEVTCVRCARYAREAHSAYSDYFKFLLSVFALVDRVNPVDIDRIRLNYEKHKWLASRYASRLELVGE